MNRIKWIVRNLTDKRVSIGVEGVDVIRPHGSTEVLQNVSSEKIIQSINVKDLILNNTIIIDEYIDDIFSLTINSTNVSENLTIQGTQELSGLSDTFISNPTSGEFLGFDGEKWTNQNIVLSGFYTNAEVDALLGEKSDIGHHHVSTDITDFNLAVQANRLDQLTAPESTVDMNGQTLSGLASPEQPDDAATRQYVESVASGLNPKASCVAGTTENITLANLQTVDSVVLTAGNRVLVKDQTDKKENGIYVVVDGGPWTRATDANEDAEIKGAYTFVTYGTEASVNSNSGWLMITQNPVIGVDDLVFSQFSASENIVAGAGLTKNGSEINVVGTTNRILANSNSIDISPNYLGQSTIDTVGSITTGQWTSTPVGLNYGGTGGNTRNTANQGIGTIFNEIIDKSINYTVLETDRGHLFNTDASGSTITHTIPDATLVGNGFLVSFRKADTSSNLVIVQGTGGQLINGNATVTLTYQNQTLTLVCNGTGYIIAQRGQKTPTPIGEGGTGADLSATGGTGKFLKQTTTGANVTVAVIGESELPSSINATKIADGTVTNEEFQRINSLTSNAQDQLDDRPTKTDPLLSVSHVLMVKKNPGTGEFSSIASAITAANLLTPDEAYPVVIWIGPGTYTEPVLILPDHVFLRGRTVPSTIIVPDGDHNVVEMSNPGGISFLTIKNATNKAGLYCSDVGNFALIHEVSIQNCAVGVWHKSNLIDSSLFLEYVDFTDCTTNTIKVESLGSKLAFLNCENLYLEYSASNPADAILIDGNFAEVNVQGCSAIGGDTTGNMVRITNGGYLNLSSARIEDWGIAFNIDNTAGTPYLKVQAADLDDNIYDIRIDNASAKGYYSGVPDWDKIYLIPGGEYFISGQINQKITVATSGGTFKSVKEAVDSLVGIASSSRRYIVEVGPGTYTEDQIMMIPYVSISGSGNTETIIQPLYNNKNFIIASANSTIKNCLVRGPTGTNFSTFDFSSSGTFRITDCRLGPAYRLVNHSFSGGGGGSGASTMILNRISAEASLNCDTCFNVFSNGTAQSVVFSLTDVYFEARGGTPLFNFIKAVGNVTTVTASGVSIFKANNLGKGFWLNNGATLICGEAVLRGFATALYSEQAGNAPSVEISNIALLENTQDLNIEHTTTSGSIFGTIDRDKCSISSQLLSTLFLDPSHSGISTFGSFYLGPKVNQMTNFLPIFENSASLGLLAGGTLSAGTGLFLNVTAGYGYLDIGNHPSEINEDDDYIMYVSWSGDSIELIPNATNYIYVDETSVIKTSISEPYYLQNILLGSVITTDNDILYIKKTQRYAIHQANRIDTAWRESLGSVYASGSTVSPQTSRKISINSGRFYYGAFEYKPTGKDKDTPFLAHWINESGEWSVESQTSVDNVYFNLIDPYGSGSRDEIGTSNFAKHSLYVSMGEIEEYLLVYSQDIYATVEEAVVASLPIPPDYFNGSICLIASIIVEEGNASIVEIRDNRPRIGFSPESAGVITNHNDLSGRGAIDAHSQYLLTSGGTMSGALNMGGKAITNVSTVNSVNLSAHAVQHQANGTDPLLCDTPVTLTATTVVNDAGLSNKFSRADHNHIIQTTTSGAASTIVATDGDKNITASHFVGALTGNADTVTGFSPTSGKTLTVQNTMTLLSSDDTTKATLPAGAVTLLSTTGSAASLTNFPTFNQSTTGSAESVKVVGGTGKITITGPGTGTTRIKTVRDANDTVLELAGDYTPTGTWIWTSAAAGTTWPTFNQNTTGTASNVTGKVAIANGGTNSSTALNGVTGRAIVSSTTAIVEHASTTATQIGYLSSVTSDIQTQLNSKSVTVQTSTTATTSLTTTAGQIVIVTVKADYICNGGGDNTITLAYNASTKDTVVVNLANNDRVSVYLHYTETPGAATQNLTLTASPAGTFNNIRYIITKIG